MRNWVWLAVGGMISGLAAAFGQDVYEGLKTRGLAVGGVFVPVEEFMAERRLWIDYEKTETHDQCGVGLDGRFYCCEPGARLQVRYWGRHQGTRYWRRRCVQS